MSFTYSEADAGLESLSDIEGYEFLSDLDLLSPPGRLTELLPDRGNRFAIESLAGFVIHIDELLPELIGQQLAEGGLPAASVADEDDVRRFVHDGHSSVDLLEADSGRTAGMFGATNGLRQAVRHEAAPRAFFT